MFNGIFSPFVNRPMILKSCGTFDILFSGITAINIPDEIKKLYNMRLGIETSFRDMKYTLNALKFHSKQIEYARHEIFARLIMNKR
ncbi:MAG: hypothetical protein IJQ99_08255, partial [Synergistaceae bacterium]|nr:hypothetical protein [Synergistaceae bacterium]